MLYRQSVGLARQKLTKDRLLHSISTADCGWKIARAYGVDPDRAYLAGVLHDIARELSTEQLLRRAKEEGIILRKEERARPFLLHGKVAALIAQEEMGIRDRGVLDAISFHVTGRRNWTRLDQVLYLADKIEPTRDYPKVDFVRMLLEKGDFDRALFECLRNTIIYACQTKGWIVDTETVVVFNEVAKTAAGY
ncbi:MAG TPA: HD domain-containing protein [Firmicutes bacterium]|nr:HD domain-containing protein [Bacillota bacterium]